MKQSMNLSFWGFSNDLVNHFAELPNHDHKTQEINLLKRKFESNIHPVSSKIQALLRALVIFRAATTPDLKESRKGCESIDHFVKSFNKMGNALNNAKAECAKENQGSNEAVVFSQAIDYAVASVEERLDNIRKNDEMLRKIYDDNPNQLKSALEKKTIKPPL